MIDGLKPYPKMKGSGVPWLGEVPEHWQAARVRAVSRIVGGGTPLTTSSQYWDGEVVWVTPTDVSKVDRLSDSSRRISSVGLASCSAELVPAGTVILSTRAPVGSIAVADVDLCTNQGCKAVVPDGARLESEYCALLLGLLKGELQSLATGTTFTELGTDKLGGVVIPLPPKDEQQKIVRFLDHADRRIQKYIRAKERLIELLEEQKQAIIHRAVTRGLDPNVLLKPSGIPWLGDIPEHWDVRHIGSLAQIGNGSTPSRGNVSYWLDGHFPWLTSGCVNRGTITGADQFVTDVALRECHLPIVSPGSLLVAITGQGKTRGKAALLHIEATINQHIAYVTPINDTVDATFLRSCLKAAYGALRAMSDDSGSTKGAITCAALKRFKVPLPPKAEQSRLQGVIDEVVASCDRSMASIEAEIRLAGEYRTRLMGDVVTGKLDVRAVTPCEESDLLRR